MGSHTKVDFFQTPLSTDDVQEVWNKSLQYSNSSVTPPAVIFLVANEIFSHNLWKTFAKNNIKILKKISTAYYMKKVFNSFLLSYFGYCQIWLNILMDHHHLSNITKLKNKILHEHVEPAVFVCQFCDVAKVAIIFKPPKKENFGDISDLKVKRNASFYILGHLLKLIIIIQPYGRKKNWLKSGLCRPVFPWKVFCIGPSHILWNQYFNVLFYLDQA